MKKGNHYKHKFSDIQASRLARAIILSSVSDYCSLLKWLEKYPEDNGTDYWDNRFNQLVETRYFFYGEWFKELTGGKINPVWLIEKMDYISKLHGNEYYINKRFLLRKVRSVMNDIWGI